MSLVDRARNMIVRPAFEWPVVSVEPATPASLYTSYIIPLAAIGPICAFVSNFVFLHHLVLGLVTGVLSFVLELAYVFVAAIIAQSLAPSFGGVSDRMAALKWIAYSYTPRWIAGFALLIPLVGALVVLVASLYSLYVLYLGAVPMMRVPQEKAVGYVVVDVLVLIVLGFLIGIVVGLATVPFLMAGALSHAATSP